MALSFDVKIATTFSMVVRAPADAATETRASGDPTVLVSVVDHRDSSSPMRHRAAMATVICDWTVRARSHTHPESSPP